MERPEVFPEAENSAVEVIGIEVSFLLNFHESMGGIVITCQYGNKEDDKYSRGCHPQSSRTIGSVSIEVSGTEVQEMGMSDRKKLFGYQFMR